MLPTCYVYTGPFPYYVLKYQGRRKGVVRSCRTWEECTCSKILMEWTWGSWLNFEHVKTKRGEDGVELERGKDVVGTCRT